MEDRLPECPLSDTTEALLRFRKRSNQWTFPIERFCVFLPDNSCTAERKKTVGRKANRIFGKDGLHGSRGSDDFNAAAAPRCEKVRADNQDAPRKRIELKSLSRYEGREGGKGKEGDPGFSDRGCKNQSTRKERRITPKEEWEKRKRGKRREKKRPGEEEKKRADEGRDRRRKAKERGNSHSRVTSQLVTLLGRGDDLSLLSLLSLFFLSSFCSTP